MYDLTRFLLKSTVESGIFLDQKDSSNLINAILYRGQFLTFSRDFWNVFFSEHPQAAVMK